MNQLGALTRRALVGLLRFLPSEQPQKIRVPLLRLAGVTFDGWATIFGFQTIDSPHMLRVGKRCFINAECWFQGNGGIELGTEVLVAPRVTILTSIYREGCHSLCASQPVVIEDGAWIGAGSTIFPGVRIGRGAIVAAGSLVQQDVPNGACFGGVPAGILHQRSVISLSSVNKSMV